MMYKKEFTKIALICLIAIGDVGAVVRLIQQNGFGTRAFSLANNYVSQSNDISGLYWNPASMAFSPVVEFHVSAGTGSFTGKSELYGSDTSSSMRGIKLPSAGVMFSLPAVRGGLTFAVAYDNPILFDDISVYTTQYKTNDNSHAYINKMFRTSGGLNFWSGGFGLQVAPRTAVGLTVSFISGKDELKDQFFQSFDGITVENYLSKVTGKYRGVDVRGGVAYKTEKFSAGARILMPQVIVLNDEEIYTDSMVTETSTYRSAAKMYSSYGGALGVSYTFPFFTITGEARATLPYDYRFPQEDIPQNSQAKFFKIGVGAGIEVPLIVKPVLLRAGYSYDEIDLHPYVIKFYDDARGQYYYDWSDDRTRADRNKHQITAGIGFFSSSVSFDLGYGFATWKLIQKNASGQDALFQDYSQHRIVATLSLRY